MSAVTVGHRPIRRPVGGQARPARPVRPVHPVRRPGVARAVRPVRRRNVALRRRVAAVLTIALVVLAICGAWALRSDAAPTATVEATVVVAPGETVWDIAYDYAPAGQHPQAYIAEVLRYNDLDAGAVAPGTLLRLPRP